MSPTVAELIAMLHHGVEMTADVGLMNSSQVLNLALACAEGPAESRLTLENYSHLDEEELRRIANAGKGKVTFR